MARKKKIIKVATISSIEIFEMQKPQFNGYTCGHGAHGHKGYNRRQEKKKFLRDVRDW